MSLTRHAILEAPDIETREVPVPEWGGTVYLRALTGAQRTPGSRPCACSAAGRWCRTP